MGFSLAPRRHSCCCWSTTTRSLLLLLVNYHQESPAPSGPLPPGEGCCCCSISTKSLLLLVHYHQESPAGGSCPLPLAICCCFSCFRKSSRILGGLKGPKQKREVLPGPWKYFLAPPKAEVLPTPLEVLLVSLRGYFGNFDPPPGAPIGHRAGGEKRGSRPDGSKGPFFKPRAGLPKCHYLEK